MAPPPFEGAPLGLKFQLIHGQLKALTNAEVKPYDLTYSQMWIMWYLQEHEGERVRQKDLCATARVKHPTMVGLLRRMEAKELVVLEADPADRRQSLVRPTDKAIELLQSQKAERDAKDRQLVEGMTPEDEQRLHELLEIVWHNLERIKKGTIDNAQDT